MNEKQEFINKEKMLYLLTLLLIISSSLLIGKGVRAVDNIPPVCDAGKSIMIIEGETGFVLNGTGSYDPDNGPFRLQHKWEFIMGPGVREMMALVEDEKFSPLLTIPSNNLGGHPYVYRLSVSDGISITQCSVDIYIAPKIADNIKSEPCIEEMPKTVLRFLLVLITSIILFIINCKYM